jgi:hypothetical protein
MGSPAHGVMNPKEASTTGRRDVLSAESRFAPWIRGFDQGRAGRRIGSVGLG